MEKLQGSLRKEDLKDLYDTYKRLDILINELNKCIKELPPKEEL